MIVSQIAKDRFRLGRSGFSLVELLVVIAIIGVLMSLGTYFILATMQGRQKSNTETAMLALKGRLDAHWDKVIKDATQETPLPANILTLAGNNQDRARIIWIKLRLIEAFPISYQEITSPTLYPNYIPLNMKKYNPTYQGNLTTLNPSGKSKNSLTESAACLILALSINRSVQPISDSDCPQADTDGDGLKELVDGWGNSLRFFRFPYGNATLNAASPSSTNKYRDPLDKNGALMLSSWSGANKNTYQSVAGYTIADPTAPTFANFVIPVLVSAGQDGQFGLNTDDSMQVTTQTQTTDNIYSYQLQLGN